MEDLLNKLEQQIGLSKEQALEVVKLVKEFIDTDENKTNWDEIFKNKYEGLKDNAKSLFNTLSSKAQEYSNKIEDKAEDLTIQAKRAVRDMSLKASELLDDSDDKKKNS